MWLNGAFRTFLVEIQGWFVLSSSWVSKGKTVASPWIPVKKHLINETKNANNVKMAQPRFKSQINSNNLFDRMFKRKKGRVQHNLFFLVIRSNKLYKLFLAKNTSNILIRLIILIHWLVIRNYEWFFGPKLPWYDVFRFDIRIREIFMSDDIAACTSS